MNDELDEFREEMRRYRRLARWGLWFAVGLNIAIPFLLWSMLGHPPPGFGIGNFTAAGMAVWVQWFTKKHGERNGG